MKSLRLTTPATIGVVVLVGLTVGAAGTLAQEAKPQPPQPGVAEVYTLEGEFVRVAYNNYGFASLGYRLANASVGDEWMMLQMGATLRGENRKFELGRAAVTLDTPGPVGIAMASQEEYMKANLQALEMRQKMMVTDSVSYFPPEARNPCRLGFFTDPENRGALVLDAIPMTPKDACLGRVYFKVPGGIQHGQHYLNVVFDKGLVRVPFRILTKEEEKTLSKSWKDIKKEHEKAFKQ